MNQTITASNGTQVESPFTDQEAYNIVSKIKEDFCQSLTSKPLNKLSYRQIPWLHIKAVRAVQTTPPKVGVETGPMEGILQMFKTASSHLKKPTIHLQTGIGLDINLRVSPPNSKNPGHIYVAGSDEGNFYYGKISPEGVYFPSKDLPEQHSIITLLRQFSLEPEFVAARYGKLTGKCCFCNRTIKDKRSADVGYGKACADRHGLKWG